MHAVLFRFPYSLLRLFIIQKPVHFLKMLHECKCHYGSFIGTMRELLIGLLFRSVHALFSSIVSVYVFCREWRLSIPAFYKLRWAVLQLVSLWSCIQTVVYKLCGFYIRFDTYRYSLEICVDVAGDEFYHALVAASSSYTWLCVTEFMGWLKYTYT